MTTIGLSYSLVKISTKCAPALGIYHAIGKEQQERLDQAAATIVDALREGSYQAP